MDAVSAPGIDRIVLMTSAQIGKTELLNNVVGFHISQDPAPILVLQPSLEMAETWSKDRLAPMLRDTPALKDKVADPRSRDSGNTMLHKRFNGGHLTVVGANSPAGLASRPIRVVLADEVDRYPASAGSEGDPLSLAVKRTATFWNRRVIMCSTPTVRGKSRIEKEFMKSDQRRYFVACPHCQHEQTLIWQQVQWPEGQPQDALYHCSECGAGWSDAERRSAVRWGKWKATAPQSRIVGFHINEIYSPWATVADMAMGFLEKKGDPNELKTWVNTALGETWEETGERIDEHELMSRAEDWGDLAPAKVLVVSVGIDVQPDRVELHRVGYGLGEEAWSLDYEVIQGDPEGKQLWADVDAYLAKPTLTADGRSLKVSATCVDSGGANTQAVYAYVRERARKKIWAIKGMAGNGKPVWPKKASVSEKSKGHFYIVGVDAAKDSIYSRLRLTEHGPGYIHFPSDRPTSFFEQLTSETVITKYVRGYPTRVWKLKKDGERNEALDTTVYAYAALQSLRVNWKRELRLAQSAARVEVAEIADVPDAPLPVPVPVYVEPKRPMFSRGVSRSSAFR